MKCLYTEVIAIASVIIGLADITLTHRPVDCPYFCAAVYQPVCGSDGQTYGNECELLGEAACNDPSVYKVDDGPCSSDGESSSVDCPYFCAAVYQPVCGSDGQTYGNECELLGEAACNDPSVYKVDDGPCSSDGESSSVNCPYFCAAVYQPVCGSDGQTYGNECELLGEAACNDLSVYKVDDGPCSSDGESSSELCPLACLEIYSPVCGSDGKTYGNDCELTRQSECYDESLYKVSDGECPYTPAPPAEELWCPQKYPDDTNSSVAGHCNRNEDCDPGFGCCWLAGCSNRRCCVELLTEPADCLDSNDTFYGEPLSLRHGERRQFGDDCPSTCFCENGRILCAVPQCAAPSTTFGAFLRFFSSCVVIIVCIAILTITKKAWARHKRVQNQHTGTSGLPRDKPPSYGEAVKMQHPSPTVFSIGGNTPPTYEQAVKMV